MSSIPVTELSPAAVRALARAGCWNDVNVVAHALALATNAQGRTRRASTARGGTDARLAALLVEIVREPAVLSHGRGTVELPRAQQLAWNTLCDRGPSAAAIAAARVWARHRLPAVRREGVLLLGTLGSVADAPQLIRRMLDAERELAQAAIWGLSSGVRTGRFSTAIRERFIAQLETIVTGRAPKYAGWTDPRVSAAAELVGLDKNSAIALLCSSRVIAASNVALRECLLEMTHLARFGTTTDRRRIRSAVDVPSLWRVFESWQCSVTIQSRKPAAQGSTDDQIAGMVLELGALADPERARTELARLEKRRVGPNSLLKWSMKDAKALLRAKLR